MALNACWQRKQDKKKQNYKDSNTDGSDDDDAEDKKYNKLSKNKKDDDCELSKKLLTQTTTVSNNTEQNKYALVAQFNDNTFDNDIYNLFKTKYVNGCMSIQDSNGLILNSKGSWYLNFKFDKDDSGNILRSSEQLRHIPKFMSTMWKLKKPKIIIPIITGVTNFKNWKNRKLEDQFKRGILKAANKTEMWFITSGINGGISQMVGDALSEEMPTQTNDPNGTKDDIEEEKANEKDRKPVVVIGIVDSSTLQNYSLFDGSNDGLITAAGNKISGKQYRFDLNANHTHFIIYDKNKKTLALGDEDSDMSYVGFRSRVELLLTRSLSHYRRTYNVGNADFSDDDMSKPMAENRQIPMVCLAIRGDLNSIDSIEFKIRKEIPVIIMKGSGGVADIIAFAFEEMCENKDPDYEDSFIKPELSKKLFEEFNDELNKNDILRNTYRDKVLTIVKNSIKGTQRFISLVDMKGLSFDFSELDKYLLISLLQSQTQLSGKSGKAQLERNLSLTIDWNREDIALSEIFQRDDYTQIEIKHAIFEKAILRLDREKFVELFLDQGFYIHRYLGRNNIRDLFERTEKRDFFTTVVLQGILGHNTSELPDNFLPDGLNYVLKKLTSIDHIVNILEIYMNQLGFYVNDAKQAEKKALNFLIIYAVLMNRHKLAKILWKRTEDPIPVALVCSMMYKNILPYCQESYVKSKIEKYQNDFADCAVGVLDMSFQENDPRVYTLLLEKYPDWNNSTALELAYNSKNLNFIAHPCCQKTLSKRLFGNIQVREFNKGFMFDLPIWMRVLSSAFFVLPMYYWIIFPIVEKKKKHEHLNSEFDDDDGEEKDEEKEEEEQTKAELNRKLLKEMKKNKNRSIRNQDASKKPVKFAGRLVSSLDNVADVTPVLGGLTSKAKQLKNEQDTPTPRVFVSPPFYRKLYMVWTAPYTKFFMNFGLYICFLALFAVVTLWPCCGNLLLDSSLWFWTATIAIEETRIAYYKYFTGSKLPLRFQLIDILIMIIFLILFLVVRIVGIWNSYEEFAGSDRIFVSKALLCVFMLYFYYRTVFLFLKISHKLGPLLVRIKLMMKNDFITYMRLFLIFMTAGGIALNAILYPFYPVGWELVKRVLIFRGFMQIFAADKADLERVTDDCRRQNLSHRANTTYSCVNMTDGIGFRYNRDKLQTYGISQDCNYMSIMAWLILIQYFLFVKLILPSLLTAMFSATGQRISNQSEQLWMYQRYEIVLDYEKRLTFPPPFTFISYIILFLEWVWHQYTCCWRKCRLACVKCGPKKQHPYSESELETENGKDSSNDKRHHMDTQLVRPTSSVYNYWRNIAQMYAKDSEKEEREKEKQKFLEISLNKVREDLNSQKKSMQRLNDRVISLEKSILHNQSYLEVIKNLLTQKTSGSNLLNRKKTNYIHILSRESPYIYTNIARFFIYEKLVPWDCVYDVYDPPFISLPADFIKIDRLFVDDEPNSKTIGSVIVDSNELANVVDNQQQPQKGYKGSQLSLSQSTKQFLWNAVVQVELVEGKHISVDRKSCITKFDEQTSVSYPLFYSLDQAGLPRNPIGRTGIRGRGALNRYGPNHEIIAIVTRWKKLKAKPIYVDRRKLLEFIACKDIATGQVRIPGDRILGDESKFSVVSRTFMELVFEETTIERAANFTEDDMNVFFASFASTRPIVQNSPTDNLADQFNELGFSVNMIYQGYIDDPRNTDNAWIEAEIWNFHYDKDEFFDKRIKNPESKWREVSSNVRIHSNEIIVDILKEICEIHNAFYT